MHYSSQAPLLLKVGACALSVLSLTLGVALASAGTLVGEGGLGAGVMGMVGLSLLLGWRDTDFSIDADGHCRYSLRRPWGKARQHSFKTDEIVDFRVVGTINWASVSINLGQESLVITESIPRTPQGKSRLRSLLTDLKATGRPLRMEPEQARYYEVEDLSEGLSG